MIHPAWTLGLILFYGSLGMWLFGHVARRLDR